MSLPRLVLAVVDSDMRQSAAVDRAIDLACRSGAHLHLLMPVFDPRVDAIAELVEPSVDRAARERVLARGHRWLEDWTQTLAAQQIRATHEAVWAPAAHEAIVAAALAMSPDLVIKDIVRSPRPRGHTTISGSDWRLARRCPVPLLLVQNAPSDRAYRIAAAVDPERSQRHAAELDDRVMQSALPLAMLLDTPLELIHVFPALQTDLDPDLELNALANRLRRADAEAFARFAERHRIPAGRCTQLVGEPADEVLRYVEERDIGLLVIGSQYWNELDDTSLGSNAEALLAQAGCDLLLVRPEGFVTACAGAALRTFETRGGSVQRNTPPL